MNLLLSFLFSLIVALPVIPRDSVNLRSYGAKGDGLTLNTKAFAQAIDELSRRGGGRLVVPEGIWMTGPIVLKSNIDLHLEKGAVVKFSSDTSLYKIIDISFEGTDNRRCVSQLYANGIHDISITGDGVFDGDGDKWRKVRRNKVSPSQWERFLKAGGVVDEKGENWYPDDGYRNRVRPTLLTFQECERVLLEGCTFQNSPSWNLHPVFCKDVTVRHVYVRNPEYASNGDGIDIDACENVLLENSFFDCGDDAICIKSGKDADGRRHARASRNILIQDCTVFHGHGGFVVGSEMSGGVHDVCVRNCRFLGTEVGIRFKSRRGRGGCVSGIVIDSITMTDIEKEAVQFDLFYFTKGDRNVPQPIDETTPEFRDIRISGVICSGAGAAIVMDGLPERPIKDVTIEDCIFRCESGIDLRRCENTTLKRVTTRVTRGEGLVMENTKNIIIQE